MTTNTKQTRSTQSTGQLELIENTISGQIVDAAIEVHKVLLTRVVNGL